MRIAAVLLTVACAGTAVVHLGFGLPLGLSLLIFFVGWPLVGTLVTLDDDLKGGWSNRDGSVRPPWLQPPFWGQVSAGVALSAAGFAIDAGWRTAAGGRCWLVSAATACIAAALFTRRRWLLAGVLVGLGALWV